MDTGTAGDGATRGWRVTWERVNANEAESGDTDRRGYLGPGGWEYGGDDPVEWTLRDALNAVCPSQDSGRWWTGYGEMDPRTGDCRTLDLHPPRGITPASYARLTRLMGL